MESDQLTATSQEVASYKKRFSFRASENIVVFRETAVVNDLSIRIMKEEVEKIAARNPGSLYLLGDLSLALPPSTKITSQVKDVMQSFDEQRIFSHIAIFGLSPLLKVIATFIMKRAIKNASISISKTEMEALLEIQAKKAK